jgi:hypothetical protein
MQPSCCATGRRLGSKRRFPAGMCGVRHHIQGHKLFKAPKRTSKDLGDAVFSESLGRAVGQGFTMRKLLVVALIAGSLVSFQARAQERAGDAALGAVSGAVVLGPVGAVAGALIGYTAGPSIARSWGARRSSSAPPPRAQRTSQSSAPPEPQSIGAGAPSQPRSLQPPSSPPPVGSPPGQPQASNQAPAITRLPPVQSLE